MKLLENPENATLMNRSELELHKDQKKVDLYREKEELLFAMDEKSHEADLTEKGRNYISPQDPEAFVLPDLATLLHDVDNGAETDPRKRLEMKAKLQADFEAKAQKIHAISQLLKAYSLYQLDVEYVLQENKVIIVDKNTGRLMPGRRWSDGLHQAVAVSYTHLPISPAKSQRLDPKPHRFRNGFQLANGGICRVKFHIFQARKFGVVVT